MNEIKMESVFLVNTIYPCWAYCLTRIGKEEYLSYQWITEDMPSMLEECISLSSFDKGDILVWKKENPEIFNCPVYIDSDGFILNRIVKYEYHAAVYEGNGYISDMTDEYNVPLNIRMRSISDVRLPDFVVSFQ